MDHGYLPAKLSIGDGGVLSVRDAEILRVSDVTDQFTDEELLGVRTVDFSHNLIADTGGLERLVNVREIDLSYNRITHLELTVLPELRKINLSHNRISTIQPVLAGPLLHHIILDHNPVHRIVAEPAAIDGLKRRMIRTLYQPVPVRISFEGIPDTDLSFFHELYERMTSIQEEDLLEEREIIALGAMLSGLLVQPESGTERNRRILHAKSFIRRLEALDHEDRNSTFLEITSEVDLQESGFRKEGKNYYCKIRFPDSSVCIDAICRKAGCKRSDLQSVVRLNQKRDDSAKRRLWKKMIYLLMAVVYLAGLYIAYKITNSFPYGLGLVTLFGGFAFIPLVLRLKNLG